MRDEHPRADRLRREPQIGEGELLLDCPAAAERSQLGAVFPDIEVEDLDRRAQNGNFRGQRDLFGEHRVERRDSLFLVVAVHCDHIDQAIEGIRVRHPRPLFGGAMTLGVCLTAASSSRRKATCRG